MTKPLQQRPSDSPFRVAVLISGGGTTLLNLAERARRGEIPIQISKVISSNPNAYGIIRAKSLNIPCSVIVRKDFANTQSFSERVFEEIRAADVDLVCLGGFLSLLSIPDDFRFKVINIHPSLLPSFGGKGMFGHHVHEAVIAAGCKITGCTVHFADQEFDTGPIIVQRSCSVFDHDSPDSLAKRVFEQECIAYPEAIQLLATGMLKIEGRRTMLDPNP